nr:MAG TPA: hypothetical protein [Caudoviricetes sp.]DAP51398.1 MAG TPA: hypothetical protein [Caudoviricetes sp.]
MAFSITSLRYCNTYSKALCLIVLPSLSIYIRFPYSSRMSMFVY